jgi:hypothetical protein
MFFILPATSNISQARRRPDYAAHASEQVNLPQLPIVWVLLMFIATTG